MRTGGGGSDSLTRSSTSWHARSATNKLHVGICWSAPAAFLHELADKLARGTYRLQTD